MKNLFLSLLLLCSVSIHAQFSAYDPFDDNANEWITRNDDTASFEVKDGKLDMNIKQDGDFINAKGANINLEKIFRAEIQTRFVSGPENVPYGMCWGASDLNNLHSFYITAEGKFGFKTMVNGIWKDVLFANPSSAINKKGSNWLRLTMIADTAGTKKLVLCINEEIVKTIDFISPFGNYFGGYIGGKNHIFFDDFIVYQRGEVQDEFEPVDLKLSLSCKADQLQYTNSLYHWSCCIPKGCRVDIDSSVTRFWFTDNRTGDYSILVVPFPSFENSSFQKASEQEFNEYMATGDSITTVKKETILTKSLGREAKVYQFGQVYTSYDLKANLYIRRYYVEHSFANESGFVFQFITPENSPYIPILDELAQQVIRTIEFR